MENKILIITINKKNNELLTQFLNENNYNSGSASSYEEIDKIDNIHEYSLALIDISGFDSKIWQRCEIFRKNNIGFLIFSPVKTLNLGQTCLNNGASAVLIKPVLMKELLFYIEHYIKGQHNEKNIAIDEA